MIMCKKSILLSIFLVLLMVACSSRKDQKEIPLIRLSSNELVTIPMSDIAYKVDYICLESTKDCMLSEWTSFYLTKDYIVAVDEEMFLFDRKEGNFLRKIGKKGQGPNEYLSTMGSSFYGQFSSVTADKGDSWIEYDCETSDAIVIKKPDVSQFMRFSSNDNANKELSIFIKPILFTMKLGPDLYAGYLYNIDGLNPFKMIYYQKDGSIVKQIPNYLTFEDNPDNIVQYEPSYYIYKDSYYFKEQFNDTLFVLKETELSPCLRFDLGEYTVPYEKQDMIEDMSACKILKMIGETDQYLFFTYDYENKKYTGIVDKSTWEIKISDNGITDDQISSLFLAPHFLYNKEMLCVVPAMLVTEYLNSNGANLQSIPEKMKLLEEDSNPVIAVVALK